MHDVNTTSNETACGCSSFQGFSEWQQDLHADFERLHLATAPCHSTYCKCRMRSKALSMSKARRPQLIQHTRCSKAAAGTDISMHPCAAVCSRIAGEKRGPECSPCCVIGFHRLSCLPFEACFCSVVVTVEAEQFSAVARQKRNIWPKRACNDPHSNHVEACLSDDLPLWPIQGQASRLFQSTRQG